MQASAALEKLTDGLDSNGLIQLIYLSQSSNRFYDGLFFMKKLFQIKDRYKEDIESIIYNYGKETSWISHLLFEFLWPSFDKFTDKYHKCWDVDDFKMFYSKYISYICKQIISLTLSHSIISKKITDNKAFIEALHLTDSSRYKLLGDCYFYMYEMNNYTDHNIYMSMMKNYCKAYNIVTNHVAPGTMERLLIVNNYSILKISFGKNVLDSISGFILLKREFDQTLLMLHELGDIEYKSATFMLSVMRQNVFSLPESFAGASFDGIYKELAGMYFVCYWGRIYGLLYPPVIINLVYQYLCEYAFHFLQYINKRVVKMVSHYMEQSDVNIQFLYYDVFPRDITKRRIIIKKSRSV